MQKNNCKINFSIAAWKTPKGLRWVYTTASKSSAELRVQQTAPMQPTVPHVNYSTDNWAQAPFPGVLPTPLWAPELLTCEKRRYPHSSQGSMSSTSTVVHVPSLQSRTW